MRKINLFIVGFGRCGTTSVYHYLKQHPDIYFPDIKEPHYWGKDVRKKDMTKERYFSLYKGRKEKYLGDASVNYVHSKEACKEIFNYNPKAKIIVQTRNTEEAVESWIHVFKNENPHKKITKKKAREYYDWKKIEVWKSTFGKRKVMIRDLSDLKKDPLKTYTEYINFLQLKTPLNLPDFYQHARRSSPKSILLQKILYHKNVEKISNILPKTLRKQIDKIKKWNYVVK